MYKMSVAIGPYGSYDPVETQSRSHWGSPGAELSVYVVHFSSLMYKRYTSDTGTEKSIEGCVFCTRQLTRGKGGNRAGTLTMLKSGIRAACATNV